MSDALGNIFWLLVMSAAYLLLPVKYDPAMRLKIYLERKAGRYPPRGPDDEY